MKGGLREQSALFAYSQAPKTEKADSHGYGVSALD